MTDLPAILLIGPTGSGKTPLGQLLARRGWLSAQRCIHFDFGENLRQVAAQTGPDNTVTAADIAFVRRVLETGALLEERDFPIAERILRRFLQRERANSQTVVVLNGLPRHVGQATAIAAILNVHTVVLLRCSPETVLARIQANTGGDRTHRKDDDLAAVRKKLTIFDQRTSPLEMHYRRRDATIVELQVTAEMSPEQMLEALQPVQGEPVRR